MHPPNSKEAPFGRLLYCIMKKYIYTILLSLVICSFSYVPVQAETVVFITQVQITGSKGNSNQDFVELYNSGSVPFNVNGYRLVKRTAQGESDTDIKAWTKDVLIPAHSFFLWANSSFTSILIKPDSVSSATLSENNGVALRFGNKNTGVLVDSIAWGNTNNSFANVSATNPGYNQALKRKDFGNVSSPFSISASGPRNSTVTDVMAAFAESQRTAFPVAYTIMPDSSQTTVPARKTADIPVPGPLVLGATSTRAMPTVVEREQAVQAADSKPQTMQQPVPNIKRGSFRYLLLAGGSLVVLIFLLLRFVFKKPR